MEMRRTLAFLGIIFAGYWLWKTDMNHDNQASLEPVVPGISRLLPDHKPTQKEVADTTAIRHWLSTEAITVSRGEMHPTKTVVHLKQRALSLTPPELAVLKDAALSPMASSDERLLAVYIIGLSESSAAREDLKEIAKTPVPVTENERARSDEVVIRANALDTVVGRLSTVESKTYLEDMAAHASEPALAKHARYWLTRLN